MPKSKSDSPLSPREAEIMALKRKGKSAREVSEKLGVHIGTVRALSARAYRKLGVTAGQRKRAESKQEPAITLMRKEVEL